MKTKIPDKSYFRIGEVSKILGVEPYVVRYWETEFRTVKPLRTQSDQRLYRRKDLEELLTIRALLYEDQFTIAGAKKMLTKRKKDSAASPEKHYKRLVALKRELQELRKLID